MTKRQADPVPLPSAPPMSHCSSSCMSNEQQIRLDITSPIKKQRHLPALQPSSSSLDCATSYKYSVEANAQAEANTAKRRQSRTRNTVLAMVIVTELIVQILSAAMVPFFPDHAKRYLNADSTIVGVIFSLYPLSLFLTSLVIGMASARFGRAFVYTSGLILLGGGTVGFGFCNDLTSIMIMRVVQGIGGGCINVAGMALLLQVSINIERDVGLDQAAIGLGYILGPPLGAILYAYMGFRDLNLVLGAIPIAQLFLFPFVAPSIPSLTSVGDTASTGTSPAKDDAPQSLEPAKGRTKPPSDDSLSLRTPIPTSLGVPSLLLEAPASLHPAQSFFALTSLPILVVATTSVFAFTSLGLFDPLVLPHLERALGASVQSVGGTFMIPCVVFTGVSLFAEGFMKRLGYKQSILMGLTLMVLGFLCLGPAPFLLGLPWTRVGAWIDQVLGFVFFGVGFAFVVVAVVPLMHSYLNHAGSEKEDFISAVNSAASSLGEFAGPILGGVMFEKLPARREISCTEGGDLNHCETGAAWTCFIFACILVPVIFFFWWLAPGQGQEMGQEKKEHRPDQGPGREGKGTGACIPVNGSEDSWRRPVGQKADDGMPQPLSRDIEAPFFSTSVLKSPTRPSPVHPRRPGGVSTRQQGDN